MKYTKLLLFVVMAFLFVGASGQQKKTGIISGMIKDLQTKSPIAEGVITVSSSAFAGQKFALTDFAGGYKIYNLPPGDYTISFEMEGYEKFVRDSITLKDGISFNISYDMVKERKRSKNQLHVTSYK